MDLTTEQRAAVSQAHSLYAEQQRELSGRRARLLPLLQRTLYTDGRFSPQENAECVRSLSCSYHMCFSIYHQGQMVLPEQQGKFHRAVLRQWLLHFVC